MGYILPVNNYQYEQYALRDIGRKTNPYKQQEVFRLFSITNSLEDKAEMQINEAHSQSVKAQEQQDSTKKKEAQRLIAKLTGKGKHMDLFV